MSVFLVDCNECFSLFLTESRFLFGVSSRMTLWEQISINFAVLINLLVAFFYPFSDGPGGKRLLEINSVDCQNCCPSLKCFLLCGAPTSRLSSSRARASLISLPIFLVLVPRAHRFSRVPYLLGFSTQALAFASVEDH